MTAVSISGSRRRPRAVGVFVLALAAAISAYKRAASAKVRMPVGQPAT
jgi:hypothetical protein